MGALTGSRATGYPQVADIARYLGVARSTIYLWTKEHSEFSDVLEAILVNSGAELVRRFSYRSPQPHHVYALIAVTHFG